MSDTQREAFEAWHKRRYGWFRKGAVDQNVIDDRQESFIAGMQAAQAADAGRELPPLPPPYEIEWPELHSQALGCGVEDRNIRDRYEAAEYGWQDGVDKAVERVPEEIFTAEQMREYARAALARAKEQK